jgi:hypothetical protein
MHLDYRLNEDRESDWSSATEEDLRYRLALGNLIFQIGDKDFGADWGWIPLIDLAASFAEIVRRLENGSPSEKFEFTESDAWILFERKGHEVALSASYHSGFSEVPLHELAREVKKLGEKLGAELTTKYPSIGSNPTFRKLLKE